MGQFSITEHSYEGAIPIFTSHIKQSSDATVRQMLEFRKALLLSRSDPEISIQLLTDLVRNQAVVSDDLSDAFKLLMDLKLIDLAKQLLDDYFSCHDPNESVDIYFDYLELYLTLEEYEEAIKASHWMLENYKSYDGDWHHSNLISGAYVCLSLSHMRIGNIELSEEYAIKAFSVEDPSPQLISFGPDSRLVKEFHESGNENMVIKLKKLASDMTEGDSDFFIDSLLER